MVLARLLAEQLVDAPNGADLVPQIVGRQHVDEPGKAALTQPVSGGEQQPAVSLIRFSGGDPTSPTS